MYPARWGTVVIGLVGKNDVHVVKQVFAAFAARDVEAVLALTIRTSSSA